MKLVKRYSKDEIFFKEILRWAPFLIYNFFLLVFNRKNFFGPLSVTWNLTYQCQLKCRHCLIEPESFSLSSEDRLKIAKNIAKSPAYWVLLSGGEALTTPEIIDIVKILKDSRGKKVILATNGLRLSNFVDDLINLELDALHISMDSHRKKVHDYLRNCPGLFDKVLKTIAEIKAKRSSKKPLIKLRCTLSKANYLEMVEYVNFWRDKVDSIHFQPVEDGVIAVRERDLKFTREDQKPLTEVFSRLQKKYRVFRGSYYTLMPDYIFNRKKLYWKLNYRCLLAPTLNLYVLPDARAVICDNTRENLNMAEDVVTEDIKKIWKSKTATKARKKLINMPPEVFCSKCFCWCSITQFNIYLVELYSFLKKVTSI